MKDKNKKIVLISGITVILLMIVGISFAIFRFGTESSNQQLVLGDIWMNYAESNGIFLEGALPGDPYSNYFEFTISGTNTYTKKDIYYDISLVRGEVPQEKEEENRIEDKYLMFRLTEVNGNTETEIFTDKTYSSLENKRIHVETIGKSVSNYSKTYRLYMTISNELTYGNAEGAILTTEEFGKIFGSVKVNVTGDFTEKEVPLAASETLIKSIESNTDESCNPIVEEDGIIYFSGSNDCVDFNYVWYSGKLWRITQINPDGTMKMITDGLMAAIVWGVEEFDPTVTSTYVASSYSTSHIRQWLNQEFLPTLYNYENIIDENAGWYSITDSSTTPTKPTGEYTLTDPVGIINAYEYYMSYKNADSRTGYLSLETDSWWTMTRYDSLSLTFIPAYNSGALSSGEAYGLEGFGVRPSIYIKNNVEFVDGSGTKGDPYMIKGDIDNASANITLLNSRASGEYVKLEGDTLNRVFRIIDQEKVGEKLTTKLVLNDYIKESGEIYPDLKYFTTSTQLWNEVSATDPTYWRGYLNTTWLETLNTNMLEKGTYYLGALSLYSHDEFGMSYKNTVCSTVSSEVSIKQCIENETVVSNISNVDYVGLQRYGEMFTAQFYRDIEMLDAKDGMWLITPVLEYSSSVYCIRSSSSLDYDYVDDYDPYAKWAARPTINLTNTVVIKSGSGTEQDPFVVGLPN